MIINLRYYDNHYHYNNLPVVSQLTHISLTEQYGEVWEEAEQNYKEVLKIRFGEDGFTVAILTFTD